MEKNLQNFGKIHVAIGADYHEGFTTLEWTLKKWPSNSITIVILYADHGITRDFVNTPIGRIPTSSLSEEKLKLLEKCDEAKTEKIIAQYVAFCKKVKTEVIKIGKHEDPLHKVLVEKITIFGITRLVMAFSFINVSSWKSKRALKASSYIYRQKPENCELHLLCEGRLILLREENEEGLYLEDDKGVKVAKLKERRLSFRGLIGKIFNENGSKNSNVIAADNTTSVTKKDKWGKVDARKVVVNHYNELYSLTAQVEPQPPQSSFSPRFYSFSDADEELSWEKCKEEIEQYFNQLEFYVARTDGDPEAPNGTLVIDLPGPRFHGEKENVRAKRTDEGLKIKIREMEEAIRLNKKEVILNGERSAKAIWAVSLCTRQAEELEGRIRKETTITMRLKKELGTTNDFLFKLQSEVKEKKTKLNLIFEMQQQISNKLQLSSAEKARVEIQLEKSIRNNADLFQEIENVRRQRDVLLRELEFSKEKDATNMAHETEGFRFDYMKFTAAEIKAATDNFSEKLRLKSANVYKGCINQTTVAIKLLESEDKLSREAFHYNVKLLNKIRHPYILGIMGFCLDPMCIVYEYMQNGCLRDVLFSKSVRNQGLGWHDRVRISSEVCTAMCFLHKANPWPVTHGNLNPSKILLDSNNVAKIYGLNPTLKNDEYDIGSDIRAFGNLLQQLLTAEWPLELAEEINEIAKLCLSSDEKKTRNFNSALLMTRIEKTRQMADQFLATEESTKGFIATQVSGNVPSMFLCPIYQTVMKNPYVASDGYTYEQEAIEKWLQKGHDTSPMTNLKLKNENLTPNHALRSMIQDWQNNNDSS